MDINHWFKEQVFSNQEDPPDSVWESIQDELDTELVWARLTGTLASEKKIPLWIYRSIAASFILLIGLSAMIFLFGKYNAAFHYPAIAVEQLPATEETSPTAPKLEVERISGVDVQLIAPASQAIQQEMLAISTPESIESQSEEKVIIIPGYQITLLSSQETADLSATHDSGFKTSRQNLGDEMLAMAMGSSSTTSFSIGLLGQFANTWLLNPKTFTGLQSQELTATNATFGKNFGMTASANLSEKTGVRADICLISQNRQNYFEYINGQYLSTGLELDYSSISIMVSRRLGISKRQHAINIGAYAGFLQQAKQVIGSTAEIITKEYSNTDLGLIAGYEYHWPITPHLFFGTGLFAKIGLTNSFSGTQEIPDFLNRTRNAAFILSFSFNYSIN